MALCATGALMYKSIKPILVNPCFIVPSSVNFQVRHAARKGYREKKSLNKKAGASEKAKSLKDDYGKRKKMVAVVKTTDLDKPEPPLDDVIIKDLFNYKKYTIPEAVLLHREYHHPEVYNNPNCALSVRIELNMTAKKKTQFIKPFKGLVSIPHPFTLKQQRDILVLCEKDDVDLAIKSGAKIAGGSDVIEKIKEGVIQPALYEYIIAHIDILPKLTVIRHHLKEKMPKAKPGTLTNDLPNAIYRHLHGIEYSCSQIGDTSDFNFIECHIGSLNMELNHLEENFKALIADIETKRPNREGDFISWIWCKSRPSPEEFSIDLSKYLKVCEENDDDDEEEVINEAEAEKLARRSLQQESVQA